MKPGDDADPGLAQWRRFGEAFMGAIPTGTAAPPGLTEAAAVFARFATDLARLAQPDAGGSGADLARLQAELRTMSERFVAGAFPAWPAAPGADPEWVRALEAWSTVLRGIAADAAGRFAARLQSLPPPSSLRESFDAWIDCAEAAFQASAHSDAFAAGQARLINEFVAQRARQQEMIERGARALGLPTRREVDALHDALRALKAAAATPPRIRKATRKRPSARKRRK